METKQSADAKVKTLGESSKKSSLVVIVIIVLVAGLAWTTYSYITARQEIAFLATPDGQVEANRRLVSETLSAIGELIVLPEGEENPFVFTIQNAEELAAQEPFYNNASDGDRLVVFSDRAIIYNPDQDILINVGPVIFQSAEEAQDSPPPPPPPDANEGEDQ